MTNHFSAIVDFFAGVYMLCSNNDIHISGIVKGLFQWKKHLDAIDGLFEKNEKMAVSHLPLICQNYISYRDAAAIATHIYGDQDASKVILYDWSPLSTQNNHDSRFDRIKFQDASTKFFSDLYIRRAGERTDYVYATRGTRLLSFKDWATNLKQTSGHAKAYDISCNNALSILSILQKEISEGKATLSFVGHSLGGGEATLNAIVTNCPAIVFNPAGVSDQQIRKHCETIAMSKQVQDELIHSIVMTNDGLNMLQDIIKEQMAHHGNVPVLRGRRVLIKSNLHRREILKAHSVFNLYQVLAKCNPYYQYPKTSFDLSVSQRIVLNQIKNIFCEQTSVIRRKLSNMLVVDNKNLQKQLVTECYNLNTSLNQRINDFWKNLNLSSYHFECNIQPNIAIICNVLERNAEDIINYYSSAVSHAFTSFHLGIPGMALIGTMSAVCEKLSPQEKSQYRICKARTILLEEMQNIEKRELEDLEKQFEKAIAKNEVLSRFEELQSYNISKIVKEGLLMKIVTYKNNLLLDLDAATPQTWNSFVQEELGSNRDDNIDFRLVNKQIDYWISSAINQKQSLSHPSNVIKEIVNSAPNWLNLLARSSYFVLGFCKFEKTVEKIALVMLFPNYRHPWYEKLLNLDSRKKTFLKDFNKFAIGMKICTIGFLTWRENSDFEKICKMKTHIKAGIQEYFDNYYLTTIKTLDLNETD